ncbi:MAG: Gfo/Idh/MocA family oxidoreductase [Pseudomonadota bacterium]
MTRLKLGMVGGGQGAFIGAVHRIAARLDDRFELVAGCLASTPERAAASAAGIGLPRSYDTYQEMAKTEAALEDGIDAVAIVTPNHMHAPVATGFLKAGIHVICDKPLTAALDDAKALQDVVAASGKLFILTHNYTGYPLIREARDRVARGDLGKILQVRAEYLQDWLAEAPPPDQKQAAWRLDPAKAGAGALGDIGTHAYNLACFVAGQQATSLAAEVSASVPGRQIDDTASVQLRLDGGARGHIHVSNAAIGHENDLSLRIYGTKGSLSWRQEAPNEMRLARFGEPVQILTRGSGAVSPAAARVTRVPPGHPEGYLEAFATIYSDASDAILAANGTTLPPDHHINTVADGVAGMEFVSACLASSDNDAAWVDLT